MLTELLNSLNELDRKLNEHYDELRYFADKYAAVTKDFFPWHNLNFIHVRNDGITFNFKEYIVWSSTEAWDKFIPLEIFSEEGYTRWEQRYLEERRLKKERLTTALKAIEELDSRAQEEYDRQLYLSLKKRFETQG